ncbi:unnamed protein product [Phyllotreta striolata]|uniref:Cuticle protein 64 n=1 Tax=Phyllotreta striolata TaxID=444603 RepID=A0A9N9TWD3_PHYSR|nr:unnamed protein product [Phyllotreta striolata]
MLRFFVVFAVMAAAYGAPGIGHGGYYGGYAHIPAATSYSSRVDIHTPVLKTYAAPALVAAPVISKAYVSPALSYHSAPLVSSYGYGVGHGLGLGHGLGYGLGHGYGGYGHDLGYGHGW